MSRTKEQAHRDLERFVRTSKQQKDRDVEPSPVIVSTAKGDPRSDFERFRRTKQEPMDRDVKPSSQKQKKDRPIETEEKQKKRFDLIKKSFAKVIDNAMNDVPQQDAIKTLDELSNLLIPFQLILATVNREDGSSASQILSRASIHKLTAYFLLKEGDDLGIAESAAEYTAKLVSPSKIRSIDLRILAKEPKTKSKKKVKGVKPSKQLMAKPKQDRFEKTVEVDFIPPKPYQRKDTKSSLLETEEDQEKSGDESSEGSDYVPNTDSSESDDVSLTESDRIDHRDESSESDDVSLTESDRIDHRDESSESDEESQKSLVIRVDGSEYLDPKEKHEFKLVTRTGKKITLKIE